MDATTSFTGKVNADAKLSVITYDVKVKLEYAFAGSALLGIIRSNTVSHFNVAASGTLNPATGAVASGSVSITGDHRGERALPRRSGGRVRRGAIADPKARASLEQMVAGVPQDGL